MKKFFGAVILVMGLLFSVGALAEDVVLPDPGYYFGRVYEDCFIWFDEYPDDEYEAYVALLTDGYGMEITESSEHPNGRECYLAMPDKEDVEALVCCFSEDDGDCGLEIVFWGDVTLSVLESYMPSESAPAADGTEIAWDDGRMIADPGDYLGYKIRVKETKDLTDSKRDGFFSYRYEATETDDILAYVDALDKSEYFDFVSELGRGKWYRLLYFTYTGPDDSIVKKGGTATTDSNLSIYIWDPGASTSEFAVYQYPGFTVNSEKTPETDDDWDGEGCSYCHGDGICNECGGTSWVWVTDWEYGADGLPERVTNNEFCSAIYCNGGSCTECGGTGNK